MSRKAVCGCEIKLQMDYRGDLEYMEIVVPCAEHSRGNAIISRFENVADVFRARVDRLRERVDGIDGALSAFDSAISRHDSDQHHADLWLEIGRTLARVEKLEEFQSDLLQDNVYVQTLLGDIGRRVVRLEAALTSEISGTEGIPFTVYPAEGNEGEK